MTISGDSLIELCEIKPFNLWEHNFDINKFGHICSDNLNFHDTDANNMCNPFFFENRKLLYDN